MFRSPARKPVILFLLKQRTSYGSGAGFSSGLYNSAVFASTMLNTAGFMSTVEEVVDGNSIDRSVTLTRPDIVIIEALWVTPEKLREVQRLHPTVHWIIRYHSEIAFLALESVALAWLKEYVVIPQVSVAANTQRAQRIFAALVSFARGPAGRVLYLPTYYPPPMPKEKDGKGGMSLNVVCPGAIRPFKNQLNQAIAAMQFAEDRHQTLFFHINGTRVEQGGEAVLANIQALFVGTRHLLIIEDWTDHDSFLTFLKHMDWGMQVSYSETFDIAAADIVAAGLPLVTSTQILWASQHGVADPNDPAEIVKVMTNVARRVPRVLRANVVGLATAAKAARQTWLSILDAL